MTASTTPSTAVATAKPLSPAAAEAQALRKMTVEIRGQQWGQSCSPEVQWAVARYCLRNGLDAVRHVEVLGGRIYLTAEFYREQGADLLLDGTVVPEEPQLIHADERLDLIAKRDDEQGRWAKAERETRERMRVQYGVDEDSPAAAVVRFRLKSGAFIVGVNWIGGKESKKRDPVGQAEPTKTAITRAERRAWRQVVEAVPSFREKVQPIEVSAKLATAEVAEVISDEKEESRPRPPAQLAAPTEPYGAAAQPRATVATEVIPARVAPPPAEPPRIAALRHKATTAAGLTEEEAEELRDYEMDHAE